MGKIKKYYICNIKSKSGIARYAEDFFRIILKPAGFELMPPDGVTNEWVLTISGDSIFHLELGVGQFAERDVLVKLIKRGFRNIDLTIHDPPWLTFPFYRTRYNLLNQISKSFDSYLHTFGAIGRMLRKCRKIFVLSQKGKELLENRHGLNNVFYMPHIIDRKKIWTKPLNVENNDILFFGFIGQNKGLDYALELHSSIHRNNSDIKMYVVGQASNKKSQIYFEKIKKKYFMGVDYLGFLKESELDDVFLRTTHVFLPFIEYKYYCPCSGSILHALRRGRIVWTNPANAINETIQDGINGRYFTGDISRDTEEFLSMIRKREDIVKLSSEAINTCQKMQEKLKLWVEGYISA